MKKYFFGNRRFNNASHKNGNKFHDFLKTTFSFTQQLNIDEITLML